MHTQSLLLAVALLAGAEGKEEPRKPLLRPRRAKHRRISKGRAFRWIESHGEADRGRGKTR